MTSRNDRNKEDEMNRTHDHEDFAALNNHDDEDEKQISKHHHLIINPLHFLFSQDPPWGAKSSSFEVQRAILHKQEAQKLKY